MASYNTVITNEGAALLASVIANQGTLTFSEMRFSTTDYDGVEQTLTVGTFGGVFITAAASGSVVDATTIKVGAQFDNSGIVGDHPLYSIGIVGTDGNTTALIAVCTTTNPDIIRAALTGVSTYAFNVNLAVSSTLNITVTGTTAAVVYNSDSINVLSDVDAPTPSDNDLLIYKGSASKWTAQANPFSNENLLLNPFFTVNQANNTSGTLNNAFVGSTLTDDWFIDRGAGTLDGTYSISGGIVTIANTNSTATCYHSQGMTKDVTENKTATISIELSDGSIVSDVIKPNASSKAVYVYDSNNVLIATVSYNRNQYRFNIVVEAGKSLSYKAVKLELGKISTLANDVAPNQTLETIKCQRADFRSVSSIQATGSTNKTGAQINAGTFFYLNGSFCKALTNIAANATFTLNTNFEVTDVSSQLTSLSDNKLNKSAQVSIAANSSATVTLSGTSQYLILFSNNVAKIATLVLAMASSLTCVDLITPGSISYSSSGLQLTLTNNSIYPANINVLALYDANA